MKLSSNYLARMPSNPVLNFSFEVKNFNWITFGRLQIGFDVLDFSNIKREKFFTSATLSASIYRRHEPILFPGLDCCVPNLVYGDGQRR